MYPGEEKLKAGQAVYTKGILSAYDFIVLGVSNRFIWKCPTYIIQNYYNSNISSNHLEVGVGTGYFLDHCKFPTYNPRLVLMDLNQNCLEYTSKRVARYKPEIYQQNILESIYKPMKPFDSIGINYVLHCIPGSITEKAVCLDNLKKLMNPGAVIFGSTILQGGVRRNPAAKMLMSVYNGRGIFSNTEDNLDDLKYELQQRFNDVLVEVAGCVALFSARG